MEQTNNNQDQRSNPNQNLDSFLDTRINFKIESKILNLLNDENFLEGLKKKLGIVPPEPEFITVQDVCKLLNIARVTCYNRTVSGVFIQHRIQGSRKVLYKKSQILGSLKAITKYKREVK